MVYNIASHKCAFWQMRYHVLRLLHGIWTPIPRSMKDYITYFKAQWLSVFILHFIMRACFGWKFSGKGFVTELVGYAMPDGRSSRGKIVCIINANIALRKSFLPSRLAGSMQCREWQEEVVGNMGSREFVERTHHQRSFRQLYLRVYTKR
ncbi:hypothetical protein LOK49_LG04G00233 [Camellia lanceoleosa]|uniref:Uncharacterized protein n=1 Tax=Camellia lanceoleosa TaxID=1840588 RepID=A0ACC0I4F1_9ERIC|nr:hypothetical protein LOK49_LG04G00233 [Camellia lanceoleosa]